MIWEVLVIGLFALALFIMGANHGLARARRGFEPVERESKEANAWVKRVLGAHRRGEAVVSLTPDEISALHLATIFGTPDEPHPPLVSAKAKLKAAYERFEIPPQGPPGPGWDGPPPQSRHVQGPLERG